MAPVRFFLLCVGMLTAQAFLTAPRQQPRVTARHGFFEDMMDKLEGKDKKKDDAAWKDEMYKAQQEILKRRRKSGT